MIGRWFRDTWYKYREQKAQEKKLHQITEQIIGVADPVIRQAKRYRAVLHEPIAGAMQYCTSSIDTVPGPVELSRRGYHADPLVNALFASPDELEEVVRISPEVRVSSHQDLIDWPHIGIVIQAYLVTHPALR